MPYAESNGLSLFYRVGGPEDDPPVLLITGLSGDHRLWGELGSTLAASFRVIAFDNRDSGQSSRADAPYAILDMARDAAGLLESLGVARTHVVGHSMGGAIAQELAISFPSVVDRLVLLGTYDAPDPRGSALLSGFASLRRELPRDEYLRLTLPWSYTYQEYEQPGFIDRLVQDVMDDPLYQEADAYDRQMEATIAFDSRERVHNISCPTLLVFGEDDVLTPMRFAHEMVQGISGSRLVTLEGTGHGFIRTRGREIADAVHGFLREGG